MLRIDGAIHRCYVFLLMVLTITVLRRIVKGNTADHSSYVHPKLSETRLVMSVKSCRLPRKSDKLTGMTPSRKVT